MLVRGQERQTSFHLFLKKNMSRTELETAIDRAALHMQELQNMQRINPLILEVVLETLRYAKDTFCASGEITGILNRAMVNDNRYDIVNEIFNLGSNSTKSVEDEKQFFAVVQRKLVSIRDKKSDLRSHCLWRTLNNENTFIKELEDSDPAHRDAVNGVVSASFLMGVFSMVVLRSPALLIMSVMVASTKFISVSGSNYRQAPSLLGQLIYQEPNIRLVGKRLHEVLPVDLASRLFNLFKIGSKIGLAVAESTVSRIERIVDHQQEARQFLDRSVHGEGLGLNQIEELPDEDTSYAARRTQMSRR